MIANRIPTRRGPINAMKMRATNPASSAASKGTPPLDCSGSLGLPALTVFNNRHSLCIQVWISIKDAGLDRHRRLLADIQARALEQTDKPVGHDRAVIGCGFNFAYRRNALASLIAAIECAQFFLIKSGDFFRG